MISAERNAPHQPRPLPELNQPGLTGRRLALFLPSLVGGGAERVMLDLAHSFADAGYPVDLVLVKAEGPYLQQVSPKVQIVDLQAGRAASSLPALVRYLRRSRPAALLTTLGHTNVVALLARSLAGLPIRVVIREANTPSLAGTRTPRRSTRVLSWLTRRLYPRADAIVAVSEGVASDMAKKLDLPPDKVTVVYNPVLTPRVLELAQEELQHPWFAPGQPPVILGIGRLAKQKDFPTLLRAFGALRKEHRARLMILGEGEERPELEALARQLGLQDDVALPGFVDNPFMYMARASLFVLSSIHEGLPNVLIQAMALGTPAVATDCPSGPREILEGGRYGPLTPVGDVDALVAAMADTLERPRRQPDADWMARYSAEAVAAQYLRLLGMTEPQGTRSTASSKER